MTRLERGIDDVVTLILRRDRGELDEQSLMRALDHWRATDGREIEHLAREAARSAGPGTRLALSERWRALSQRLDANSKPPNAHDE